MSGRNLDGGNMKSLTMGLRRGVLLGVLAAACAGLGGCAMWDAWMNFWGFGQGPVVVSQKTTLGNASPENHMVVDNTPRPRVHLFRLYLPVGTVSGNDKVWRQLDEDALDSQTSVMLAQNGMRAGIGPVARWAALSKMLDVPGAAQQEFFCQTDGKSPLSVVVHEEVGEQIIVSIDRDNAQQGRTFERCDNAFRLSMSLLKDRPDLMIQLEPIVQFGSAGGTRPPTGEVTFADMRLWTTVKPEQFLVVSAADPKANRFSVGTRFLSNNEKVPATETVLVFVPIAAEK